MFKLYTKDICPSCKNKLDIINTSNRVSKGCKNCEIYVLSKEEVEEYNAVEKRLYELLNKEIIS